MEQYEYEEDALSIKDILKVCIGVSRAARIRFGIIVGAIFLATLLIIQLVYNPMKGKYTSTWYYDVYTLTNNDMTYLDGDKLIVNDLASYKNLENIVSNNEELSSIKVADIYYSNDFSLVREDVETTSGIVSYFTVTMKTNSFSSLKQAKEFVEALSFVPIEETKRLIDTIDNTSFLRAFKKYSETYEEKILALNNQSQLILTSYQDLMKIYGDKRVNDHYVSDYYNDAVSTIESLNLTLLSSEVKNNGYVYNYEKNLPTLQAKKVDLEKQIDVIQKKIDALQAQGFSTNDKLSECIVRKEDLQEELNDVNTFITNGATADTTAFDTKLENCYNELNNLAESLTTSQKEVYSQKQNVYYSTNSIISKTGTMSLFTSGGLSLLLGLVVGVVVNLALDMTKYKKQLKKKKKEEEETV